MFAVWPGHAGTIMDELAAVTGEEQVAVVKPFKKALDQLPGTDKYRR